MSKLYVGPDKEHQSIQDALTISNEGGTIFLSTGRYEESLIINVPGLTICAEQKGSAVISSPPEEPEWCAIDVQAPGVKLDGLVVEGQSDPPGSEDKLTSAILIQETDASVVGCKVTGSESIGIKFYSKRTTIRDCNISTGRSAVIALDGASATIENSKVVSAKDTGIWLWGASSSTITKTSVKKCGNTGIMLDCAPASLKEVEVVECCRGVVSDWPMKYSLQNDEYFSLSHQGHLFDNVKVSDSEESGLHVYPGTRVVANECSFLNNGDAGAFFEGHEADDEEEQERRRARAEACDQSLIRDSDMSGNAGYGVEAESIGLVMLVGENKIENNTKGACDGVAASGKRARVATSTPTEANSNETDISSLASSTNASSAGSSGQNDPVDDADGDIQEKYDALMKMPGVCPYAVIYEKKGHKLPLRWPPSLIFTGDVNVDSWPGYDKIEQWLMNNTPRPNAKVEIRPSLDPERGMGLVATKKLYQGTVVGFYTGILRRQQTHHDSEYVAKYRPVGTERDDEWEIDAEHGGSEMRFANYPNSDEEPNMEAVYLKRRGRQVIAFKMLKDVEQGDELLWDYGDDYLEEDE